MNKVYLHFKEFELGYLIQSERGYVWVPNCEKINKCFSRYDGAVDVFMLDLKNETIHRQIPYHFYEYLESTERSDIMKKANINSNDSDFTKLYKVAALKFLNNDFYISI